MWIVDYLKFINECLRIVNHYLTRRKKVFGLVEAENIVAVLKYVFGYLIELGSAGEINTSTLLTIIAIVVITAEIVVRLLRIRITGTTVSSALTLVIYDALTKGYSLTQILSFILLTLSIGLTVIVGLARLILMLIDQLLKHKTPAQISEKGEHISQRK